MAVFDEYARYYDLLYKDKDYAGEAAFVLDCLTRAGCAPRTLLDLGCGTGRHALALANRGLTVTGVDMSQTMLDMGARLFAHTAPLPEGTPLPDLHLGDARSARLGRRFDAVISLFHVLSYQNSEQDAVDFFRTAREHLSPGGFFLCDFWYGPGVLTDLPTHRKRRLEDEAVRMVRLADPEHLVNENIVRVYYKISLTDKATRKVAEIEECHSMRYWFLPELRYLAGQAGFTACKEGVWMEDRAPERSTWNAWMLFQV